MGLATAAMWSLNSTYVIKSAIIIVCLVTTFLIQTFCPTLVNVMLRNGNNFFRNKVGRASFVTVDSKGKVDVIQEHDRKNMRRSVSLQQLPIANNIAVRLGSTVLLNPLIEDENDDLFALSSLPYFQELRKTSLLNQLRKVQSMNNISDVAPGRINQDSKLELSKVPTQTYK